MAPRIKLGELLVRAGVLDEYKLNAALAEQTRWGGRIGKILVDMNFVSEEILVKALSKQLAVPLARLDTINVPVEVVARIDMDFAKAKHFCPERVIPDRRTLVLAMADPIDVKTIDEITYLTGLRIEPTLAGERAITLAISRLWGADMSPIDAGGGEPVFVNNQGGILEASRPPPGLEAQIEALPVAASIDGPEPVTPEPEVEESPMSGMVDTLDSAQKKQLRAIRAMVDLLVDKGVFSRDEYLARLNRR